MYLKFEFKSKYLLIKIILLFMRLGGLLNTYWQFYHHLFFDNYNNFKLQNKYLIILILNLIQFKVNQTLLDHKTSSYFHN